MSDALLETVESLIAIMEAETAALALPDWDKGLAELAAAKLRLTGTLEAQAAALSREQPDWLDAVVTQGAGELGHALDRLRTTAETNARVIGRQIDLSRDLLDAVADEARRIAGTRQDVYGAEGSLTRTVDPAPVAVNAQL